MQFMGAGFRRARHELLGPFNATDPAPFRGSAAERIFADWATTSSTPDEVWKWSAERIRTKADDLAAANPYVRAYLNLLPNNVIGPHGFSLQAQIRQGGDGDLIPWINDRIEDAWSEFELDPFVDHRLTLVRGEYNALRAVARAGEVFVRFYHKFRGNRFGLGMQLVDACMIDSGLSRRAEGGKPEIRCGVAVDEWGAAIGYYLRDSYDPAGQPKFVSARSMLHLYDPDRVNQTRGISWLAPVMGTVWLLDRYEEAELVAARVAAGKTGFFQSREGAEVTVPEPEDDGDEDSENSPLEMSADPGVAHQLEPGWEFVPWNPEHPTQAFPIFVKTQLMKISTGLSVSYAGLSGDLSGASYSSMRTGTLIERAHWKALQAWWRDTFRRRVYNEWLEASLMTGAFKLDSRQVEQFQAVRWTGQGFPWVDPKNDVESIAIAIANGLTSRTAELAEKGEDFEDVIEALEEEAKLAAAAGVSIVSTPQPNGKSTSDPAADPGADPAADPATDGSEDNADARPRTVLGKLHQVRRRRVKRYGEVHMRAMNNLRPR